MFKIGLRYRTILQWTLSTRCVMHFAIASANYVIVNPILRIIRIMEAGVPQGSVLGPLFFTVSKKKEISSIFFINQPKYILHICNSLSLFWMMKTLREFKQKIVTPRLEFISNFSCGIFLRVYVERSASTVSVTYSLNKFAGPSLNKT